MFDLLEKGKQTLLFFTCVYNYCNLIKCLRKNVKCKLIYELINAERDVANLIITRSHFHLLIDNMVIQKAFENVFTF